MSLKLNEEQLQILKLYGEGYGQKQIAEKMNMQPKSISWFLMKARQANNNMTTYQLLATAIRKCRI